MVCYDYHSVNLADTAVKSDKVIDKCMYTIS